MLMAKVSDVGNSQNPRTAVGDDDVDISDLGILLANFGRTCFGP